MAGPFVFVILCVSFLCGILVRAVDLESLQSSLSEFMDGANNTHDGSHQNGSFYISPDVFNHLVNASDLSTHNASVTELSNATELNNSTDPADEITVVARHPATDPVGVVSVVDEHHANMTLNKTLEVIPSVPDEHFTEDLTVTDETGCFSALRDQYEEKCFSKFEDTLVHMEVEEESARRKEVCCAVELYEKCSLKGYEKASCTVDRKELRETLKAARIFMGAMSNISCSEHRGMCASTSASFSPALVPMFISIFVLLL